LSPFSRAKGITKKVAEWRLGDTEEHSERRGSNTSDVITASSRDDVLLDVLEGSISNSENKNGETHNNGDFQNSAVGDKGIEKGVEDADKIVQESKDVKGGEGENMSVSTSVSTSTRTPAMRTLIVLFDNTYSWYQPKELK
jgi:hypothetical protein